MSSWPISAQGLKNLEFYKYSGEDQSILVRIFFRDFWNWCISLWPLWVAPNLITLLGFSCVITGYISFVLLTPTFTESPPLWYYFLFPVMIFTYQVLDNIDGRQARRTGTSSPLGELFDHACDSLYATLAVVPTIYCIGAPSLLMMYVGGSIYGFIPFYIAHWEEYYANILVLGKVINPTEAQLFQCAVFLITGIFGRDLWRTEFTVPFLDISMKFYEFMVYLQCAGLVYMIFSSGSIVNEAIRRNRKNPRKLGNWQKGNFWQAVSLLVPILVLFFSSLYWFAYSVSDVLHVHTHVCFLMNGFVFASMLNRMMVDRITKIRTSPLHWQLLVPLTGAFSTYLGFEHDDVILLAGTVVLVLTYFQFVTAVINQLCDALNIHCFRIPYPPPSQQSQNVKGK